LQARRYLPPHQLQRGATSLSFCLSMAQSRKLRPGRWLRCILLSSAVLRRAHCREGPPDFRCDQQPEGAYDPITIRNAAGTLEATFLRYGGTLTHLLFTGGTEVQGPVDVALGWEDPRQHCRAPQHQYFGASVGRVANRIANGTFVLGGATYTLPRNENGYDTLHGGWFGFDRQVFDVVTRSASSVTFQHVSRDGEEGFPGTLTVQITHSISDDNEWQLHYHATTDRDTVVSLTSHPYFNLNGNINNMLTVLEHEIRIPTGDRFIEVDSHLVATGAIGSVSEATHLDFTTPKTLGRDIDRGTVTPQGGYDNAWVIGDARPTLRQGALALALEAYTPLTGIGMRVRTDQPSLQIYSGNFLNGTDPKTRMPRKRSQSFGLEPQYYQWRGALVVEAQQYPDAVNHANFPSVVLRLGEVYSQRTSYQLFGQSPRDHGSKAASLGMQLLGPWPSFAVQSWAVLLLVVVACALDRGRRLSTVLGGWASRPAGWALSHARGLEPRLK